MNKTDRSNYTSNFSKVNNFLISTYCENWRQVSDQLTSTVYSRYRIIIGSLCGANWAAKTFTNSYTVVASSTGPNTPMGTSSPESNASICAILDTSIHIIRRAYRSTHTHTHTDTSHQRVQYIPHPPKHPVSQYRISNRTEQSARYHDYDDARAQKDEAHAPVE